MTAASPPGPGHCLQDPSYLGLCLPYAIFRSCIAAPSVLPTLIGGSALAKDDGQGARSAPSGRALDRRRSGRDWQWLLSAARRFSAFSTAWHLTRFMASCMSCLVYSRSCRLYRTVLCDRPDKARQLACDGHHGNLWQLASAHQPPVFPMQPLLCPPRDVHDVRGTAAAPLDEPPVSAPGSRGCAQSPYSGFSPVMP